MFEPYASRLGAKDKIAFEEAFGAGFRAGSPFRQPYDAFLSALIGQILLTDIAFGKLVPVDRRTQYPGVWTDRMSFGIHEACQALYSDKVTFESSLPISACQQLTVFCYEKVKALNDRSTEFDFFRHVRNACAHGNRFTFPRPPRGLPARWRGAEINKHIEGHCCILGLVGIPDILLLLKDIEHKLPETAFDA